MIISVNEVKFGGNTKRAGKRFGWCVMYHGAVEQEVAVPYTRTINLITGALLKKPVQDTRIERRSVSGVISRVVRRRSTLRKMGVKL